MKEYTADVRITISFNGPENDEHSVRAIAESIARQLCVGDYVIEHRVELICDDVGDRIYEL